MKKPRFKRNIFCKDKLSSWARKVKIRDGFKCVGCGYGKYVHSHHILPKGKNPKYAYSIWNGVTLCKRCHLGKSGVHGSGKPRNKIVTELRKLMFCKSIEKVKLFNKRVSLNPNPKKVKYKPYVKLKKGFKRKLY